MEQAKADQIRFREVDKDGNPADPAIQAQESPDSWESERGRAAINPFIVILWVFACALVSGGVWIYSDVYSMSSAAFGPSTSMPVSMALMGIAPFALVGGMLAMILLLFWHAIHWQRRRVIILPKP